MIGLVNGGSVDALLAYNNSVVNFNSGSVANGLSAYNTATINLMGGAIINNVNAYNGSRINVSGGHIANFIIGNTSVLNFFGTGLSATFVNSSFTLTNYTLAGTLADGTSLNGATLAVGNNSSARFIFNNVPEPGSMALLFGVTGVGLLGYKRRR